MSSNGSSITANRKDPPSRIQTIALTANNNNNNKNNNNNNNNSDEVITSPPLFTAQESAVDDKASSTQTKKYSSVDQIDSPPSALTHRPLARPADGRSLDSLLNSPISDSSVNRLSQSGASTNWIEYLKQSRTKLNDDRRTTVHVFPSGKEATPKDSLDTSSVNASDNDNSFNRSSSSASPTVLTDREREQLTAKRLSDLPALPVPAPRSRIIKVHELSDWDDLTAAVEADDQSNNNNRLLEQALVDGASLSSEYRSIQVPSQARVIDALMLVLKKWRYLTANQIANMKTSDGGTAVSDALRQSILADGWELLQLEGQNQPNSDAAGGNDENGTKQSPLPKIEGRPFTLLHPDTPVDALGDYFLFRKRSVITAATQLIGSDYQPSKEFRPCTLFKLDSKYPAVNSIKPLARIPQKQWQKRFAVVGKGGRHLMLFSSESESLFLNNCMHDIDLDKVQFCDPFPIAVTRPSTNSTSGSDLEIMEIASFGVKLQTRTRRIFLCFKQESVRDQFLHEISCIRMKLFAKDKRPIKNRQLAQLQTLFTRTDSDSSTFSLDAAQYLSPTQRLILRLESTRRLNDIDWPPFDSIEEAQKQRWAAETNLHLFRVLRDRAFAGLKRFILKYQLPVPADDVHALELECKLPSEKNSSDDGDAAAANANANAAVNNNNNNESMFNSPTPTFGDQQHQHHGGKDGSGTSKQVVQSVKKFIRGLGGGSSSSAPASSTGSPLDTHLSPVFGSAGILHSGGNTSTHGNGGGLVLFSQSLEVLSQRYDPFHANCPHLPPLIEQTIQYLASNGPQANGIFRIAGSVKRMDALRRQFDRFDSSKAVEVFDFSPYTVHDVAGVFKQFLRDLPEPLLSGRLYRFFLAAEKLGPVELKRQYLRLLVMLLPPVSRLLLYRLLELLNKIAASSEDRVDPETGQPVGTGNLMTASNLGVVIGPNILRDMSPASLDDSNSKNKTGSGTTVNTSSPDLLAQDNTAAINAVKCLIEEYQLLFIIPEEVIEKLKLHAAIPLKYTLALKK